MSFSIISQPHAYSPVFNPMWLKVSDTEYTLPDHQYIFEVRYKKVSTDDYTSMGFFKVYPKSTGYGEIDISPILRQATSYVYRKISSGGVFLYDTDNIQYVVYISRQYYDSTTGAYLIEDLGDTSSSNLYCWGGTYKTNSFLTYSTDYSNSVYPVANNNNFLSNIPVKGPTSGAYFREDNNLQYEVEMTRDEWMLVDYLSCRPDSVGASANQVRSLHFFVYNTSLDQYGQREYVLTDTDFPKSVSKFHTFTGIGPGNWMGLTSSTLDECIWLGPPTPFYPVYRSGDYKYRVDFMNSLGATVMNPIHIKLVNPDRITKSKRRWLIYRSNKGGWSQILFETNPTITQGSETLTYSKNLSSSYNELDSETGIYANIRNREITLTKLWVENQEMGWLDDILSSPQHFLYQPYSSTRGDVLDYRKAVMPVYLIPQSLQLIERWTGNRVLQLKVVESNNQNMLR